MKFVSALKLKLIYVFRINDEAHKGCLKIGEATASDEENLWGLAPNSKALNTAAKKRINQYTQTAGIAYDLLYTELSIFTKNGALCSLNDNEVHNVLIRSGIKRKDFKIDGVANEWFVTDLTTVQQAISAAKEGKQSLHVSQISTSRNPIVFRPEQLEAIDKTIKHFKKGNQFLWNAKMRFGKTLSAMQVVKEMDFKRTLILTHRPVVDEGWFDDFGKIFYDRAHYSYGSKNNGDNFGILEATARRSDNHYIYFASVQDLRGSELVGGNFIKNEQIFATPWDLIIVDEAHEGLKTDLGTAVMSELTKTDTKVLRLSGTPFNLLDDYKENEIYTWDYVMEQRAKQEWDKTHFGDPNPYAGLPRLNIFTYDLGKLIANYADNELAFNFREFFRVDETGAFIHQQDVSSFLNLITKSDKDSQYPFSTKAYRENFRHSLWVVPGVKEARALSVMLKQHPVFQHFEVVNVAGEGDEEANYSDALKAVKDAIGNKPEETYTITISCGRLTTGVSVKAWTAVLMLAGSFNTSASSYMQTIFRVQTPAVIGGKVKDECFVFDFAPDRTLKVIAETAKISAKAGKTSNDDRAIMGAFLNFCPIISIDGSQMREYNTSRMLEQLKKVYIERVVRNGFEDGYLYNDQLMRLDDVELNEFNELKGIIGATKAMPKSGDIDLNNQGFSNEEYEQLGDAEKKNRKKEELTEEEKKLLEEKVKKRKNRDTAISILRGISIRMPLLIYGAELTDESQVITIDNFASLIDPQSWEEFMPKGITKQIFNGFKKYYDPEIFCAAGKRIREMAQAADLLSVEERIERIASIFSSFRNPDKETVLTPWRVVNMHLGDCLGGYVFYDENYDNTLTEPRFVNHGQVTEDVFSTDTRILEINSKSGLYPLYIAYSVYRNRLQKLPLKEQSTIEGQLKIWDQVCAENIFVLCKTPMAKSITKRTLVGFRDVKIHARYFKDLISQITNKSDNFLSKILNGKEYWKANNDIKMKFKAIVGNPPYQVMDGGSKSSATPLYDKFIDISKKLKPNYLSMIIPAKWYNGGRGLDDFRSKMLGDSRMKKLFDYPDSNDCFRGVDIAGGICYFLWDDIHSGLCSVVNINNGKRVKKERCLSEYKTFIRSSEALSIIEKVLEIEDKPFLDSMVSSQKPFGLRTYVKPTESGDLTLRYSGGKGPFNRIDVTTGSNWIDKWKVITSYLTYDHAGKAGKDGRKRIISTLEILKPQEICTETYIVIGSYDSENQVINLFEYIKTKFVRFLISQLTSTQHLSKGNFAFVPLQDFSQSWSDSELYAKYNLTEEEIAFIESSIKSMQ